MPFILVADDSATDRQIIGGLLSRDIEWIVEYAEDGEKAMSMKQSPFKNLARLGNYAFSLVEEKNATQ